MSISVTLTANNDTQLISGGDYSFKVDGALDLQWQLDTEGFTTIDDGSFSGAGTGVLSLPECTLKVINASTNEIVLSRVRY